MTTSNTPHKVNPMIAISVWGSAMLFTLLQFLIQLSSGVIVQQLMTSFSLNAFGAGLLASAYYYIYVFLQVPAGMLFDKFNPRYLLSAGALLCGGSTLLFSMCHSMGFAILFRLLMGTGGAVAFVGTLHLMRGWYPENRFALLVGITEATGMLATMVGSIALAELIVNVGWRSGMATIGYTAMTIGVLCFMVIKEGPYKSKKTKTPITFSMRLKWVLQDTVLLWNGLYCGIFFSVISVFSALWGVPFLQRLAGFSLAEATGSASLILVGAALGAPIIGYAYSRCKNYRALLIAGALLECILLLLLLWLPFISRWELNGLLLLNGIGSSFYILNFTLANELSHPEAKSTAIGYTNALCVVTAPLFQPIIGYLISDVASWHQPVAHIQYTLLDYQASLSILPALMLFAAGIAYFLPAIPKYAKKTTLLAQFKHQDL